MTSDLYVLNFGMVFTFSKTDVVFDVIEFKVCTLSVADGCCCFLVVLFTAWFKSEQNVFGVGDRAVDLVAFVDLLGFAIDCICEFVTIVVVDVFPEWAIRLAWL